MPRGAEPGDDPRGGLVARGALEREHRRHREPGRASQRGQAGGRRDLDRRGDAGDLGVLGLVAGFLRTHGRGRTLSGDSAVRKDQRADSRATTKGPGGDQTAGALVVPSAHGVVVDSVKVSVLLYAPVRSASLAAIDCLKLIVAVSLLTGPPQVRSVVGLAVPPSGRNALAPGRDLQRLRHHERAVDQMARVGRARVGHRQRGVAGRGDHGRGRRGRVVARHARRERRRTRPPARASARASPAPCRSPRRRRPRPGAPSAPAPWPSPRGPRCPSSARAACARRTARRTAPCR